MLTDINNGWKDKLYIFANILFIAFGFFLFFDAKVSRVILIAILFIWVISGDYKKKIKLIIINPIAVTFLVFIGLFIFGLLWTEDLYAGRKILERQLLYLVVPLMVSMYHKSFLKYYLFSMLLAIIYTSVVTVLIRHELLDMRYEAGKSPYINRVYLAGMLTFVYSYLLSKVNFKNSFNTLVLAIAIFLVAYTLIISGSRMGYINLSVATIFVLFYKRKLNYIYALTNIIIVLMAAYSLYSFNDSVKGRVHKTVNVLKNMELMAQVEGRDSLKRTSLTCRFEFWRYAYNIGTKHYLLGVGSGDGILELERYLGKDEAWQLFSDCQGAGSGQFNPHNMYLFMFMQFGLLGVVVLLWILYVHLSIALKSGSVGFIVLIVTTILTLFSLSELFTSRYFISFYGYSVIVMYLIFKESEEDKRFIKWK